MGVEASHDDLVITKFNIKVKVWCEIVGKARNRRNINVMDVDRDIVDGGCNGEVLEEGVTREK